MSSIYSKNFKTLSGVTVVPSNYVWVQNKNNTFSIRPGVIVLGKVESAFSNFVLKANKPNKKTSYVEDVCALPQRTKNEIINHFFDKKGKRNKNTVAYLVRTDKAANQLALQNLAKSQKGKGVKP
ncbi:MAG: hypothetical protein J6C97_01155 [Clostridia bacterium]|nr:hypothetical protein [Clostridia bacterium]